MKASANDQEVLKTCLQFVRDSQTNIDARVTRQRNSRAIYNGFHWSAAELEAYRKKNIEPITINHVLPIVNTLAGIQRQNRQDIRVRPRRNATETVANVHTELIKHTMDRANGDFITSQCFQHGIITGGDFLVGDINWTDTPGGSIDLDHMSCFNVIPDPTATNYDLDKDARFVILQHWRDKEELSLLYPDKGTAFMKTNLDTVDDDPTGLLDFLVPDDTDYDAHANEDDSILALKKKRKYMVREIRWRKKILVGVWIDKEKDETKVLTKKADITQAKRSTKFMPERFELIEEVRDEIHRTELCGQVLLKDEIDPWKGLDTLFIFRFSPYWDAGFEFGVIDNLISPQREENLNRTQATRLLNQTANTGWLVEKVNKVYKKTLEMFGSIPGIVIQRAKCGGYAERLQPNQLSTGHAELSKLSAIDIREISSVNDSMQGYDTGRAESGKALQIKQRQGMTASEVIFDNFEFTLVMLGKVLVQCIQNLPIYTDEEIRKVISQSRLVNQELMEQAQQDIGYQLREPQIPQEPDPIKMQGLDPESQQLVAASYSEAVQGETEYAEQYYPKMQNSYENIIRLHAEEMLLKQLRDDDTGEYGIAITMNQSAPTVRMSNLVELSEINAAYPGAIPPKVFVAATDLQDKEEIVAGIEANLEAQRAAAAQGVAV